MRKRRAGAVVLAIIMTLVVGPPAAADPPKQGRTVTLITGDRVLVGKDGVTMRPVAGKGRERIRFVFRKANGHSYVVPTDALAMLRTGALDWRLFDVAGLLAIGYDDAKRDDLPLIVRTSGDTPTNARLTRQLSTLDVEAMRATKDSRFWTEIKKDKSAKVWLDGVRRPALDRSVPHIGAPAAWAAGYTGMGVIVGVLDTGIDATHPDLAGQISDARNFTDEPVHSDTIGHGTHVASTIAGTGAVYRGVAPGASLLDAKVCDSYGCPESAILAGMEWAAAEKGATVVNLSLGGQDGPEIDPLEEAVNRLTATYGTLFVIAAGNSGRCSQSDQIASPASAEAALTVGATDLADDIADFSCHGPTVGTSRLKPDIVAPGVGIVAARVPGTPVGDEDPVDERYARVSGTSMATPHVAGAAALLAQQHPDWKANLLKATLMGSALTNPNLTVYQQGAGRVDVARAIGQSVTTSPPSLSFGRQLWPHTDDEATTQTLTYRNTGPASVTLAVRLEITGPTGQPAPAGMFTPSATTVTVPAGGETSLTVTANTRVAGPDGTYSGRVIATGGSTVVGTPIAVDREVESYDLTVKALDRNGAPTDQWVGDVYLPDRPEILNGGGTMRLPRGRYDVLSFVFTDGVPDPAGSLSLLGTEITLTADTTLTFDSRRARPVEVVPPRASARMVAGMIAVAGAQDGYGYTFGLFARDSYHGLYSGHMGPAVDRNRFSSYVYGAWAEPGPIGNFTDSPYTYNLTWFSPGRVFDGLIRHPREKELATVRSGYSSAPARLITKYDFARLAGTQSVTTVGVQLEFFAPATRTEYFTTDNVEWLTDVTRYDSLGFEAYQGAVWRPYARGPQREQWGGVGVIGPALPTPYFSEVWVRQFPETLVFRVPMHSDATPGHYGDVRTTSASTSLYADGRLVSQTDQPGYVLYQAPAVAATIRVDTAATQDVYDTSTEIRSSWQFRTGPVAGPEASLLAAMVVRFRPGLDSANSLQGGRPYLLPVTVQRQPGAPAARVASLTLDVSYDDGRTWRRTPIIKAGTQWFAPVVHPASGFVSLRAKAVDTDGNSVEQTIIRAYRLR